VPPSGCVGDRCNVRSRAAIGMGKPCNLETAPVPSAGCRELRSTQVFYGLA
jgi:hypothetical protein